jgi:phosphate-selective porin OprO/OprP
MTIPEPFKYMTGSRNRQMCSMALIILLSAAGSVWAQEESEVVTEKELEKAKAEEVEASSNLRDSVHENLETIQEDAQAAEEKGQEKAEILARDQQQEIVENQADSQSGTDDTPVDEDKSIMDWLKSIPIFLQSVPERVPFIRDRGLIFFGRTEIDYAHYFSGILSSDSGFRVRSLRAGLAKAFKHNLSMKAEIDLTDGDSNFADLYVRHRHPRWGLLTVGNQRVAQTLVNQTSRISRTFMEEPLPAEAFGLGRRLALGWDLNKPKGGIHLTAFGPDLNGSIGDSGFAGRVYFNPTRSRFHLFHVGASLVSENMSRKTRFFAHPESRVTDQRLVDTGIYEDVNHQYISALEVAGARDSFMFRAEFFRADWKRATANDPTFKGFYTQASWILTGESFNYTQGKFTRVRPQSQRGAWETGVRFSRVDLNSTTIFGGEEKNLTVALNWYAPANQFRVMSNLIFVRTDEYAGDEDSIILQVRAQFHW